MCFMRIENMLNTPQGNFNEKDMFQLYDLCFIIISWKNKHKKAQLVTPDTQC